jgi:hypothetical protein
MILDLEGCARCHGEKHNNLEFKKLTNPMVVGDVTITHWAMCPSINEPILLQITTNPINCNR